MYNVVWWGRQRRHCAARFCRTMSSHRITKNKSVHMFSTTTTTTKTYTPRFHAFWPDELLIKHNWPFRTYHKEEDDAKPTNQLGYLSASICVPGRRHRLVVLSQQSWKEHGVFEQLVLSQRDIRLMIMYWTSSYAVHSKDHHGQSLALIMFCHDF